MVGPSCSGIGMVAEWLLNAGNSHVEVSFGNWRPEEQIVHPKLREWDAVLLALEENCPALRSLNIEFLSLSFPKAMLRATLGRLHKLVANRWALSGDVEQYCSGLRNLTLHTAKIDK